MPFKVPRAERRVALQPLPSARQVSPTRAGDFGGFEADVIGRVGGQVERLGRTALAVEEREELLAAQAAEKEIERQAKLKNRRDQLLASDALVELKDNLRNQKEVFKNRRGIDAFGVTNEANEHIEKLKKELKGKMENDEIRAFFDAATIAPRELFLNQVLTHEASEFNKAEDDNINARIDTSILEASDAVGGGNDELAIHSAKLDLETAIEQKTEKAGMTGAAAKNFKDGLTSTFHLSVLNRKVALNAIDAKEYYDKNKKEIDPDKREPIEKLLNKEDVLQFSKDKADEIEIKTEDPADWIPTARKEIKDAKKLDATIKRLTTRKNALEQLDKEAQKEAYLDTLDKIMTVAKNEEEGLDIAANLENPEDQLKAEKVARERFKRKEKDATTSRKVQAEVLEMIEAKEITRPTELIEFYPDLKDEHYNTLLTRLKNKQNPNMKIPAVSYSIAKNALESAIGEPYRVEDHNKMFMYVLDKLDKEAQVLGRSPTLDEAVKLTSKYIIEGEKAGEGIWTLWGSWDPDRSLFEAVQEGSLDTWLPPINETDVDKGVERRTIIGAFTKSLGFVIDNDILFKLYKKEEILGEELSPEQNKLYRQELEKELRKRTR
jgi:hypothetical protein